ncbi:MAG: OPT/YSL family transporter [Phycisphaerae bacterium]|nr:OPT/YSL family transporter [Phycisphaerae bacterium]
MNNGTTPDEDHAEPGPPDTRAEEANAGVSGLEPLPLDLISPQFTIRAVLTGMVLGGLLSVCNIYAGLKVGLAFNMSIAAALLSYGLWMGLYQLSGRRIRPWGILENNISQTACSSGAYVSSAGLVATIPALTIVTGQTLDWHFLALWLLSVCLLGIVVAIGLRRQMLLVDKLTFPVGTACAETMRGLYAKGSNAAARVLALLAAGIIAAGLELTKYIGGVKATAWGLGAYAIPGSVRGLSLKPLTFSLETSPFLLAIGGLIGFRACVSLLVGAIIAYGFLAPPLIESGTMRLTTRQPLAILPEDIDVEQEFKAHKHGHLEYDTRHHRLTYKGFMSEAERAEFQTLSADLFFQEAVQKLYLSSQLTLPEIRDYTTTRRIRISEQLSDYPEGFVIPQRCDGIVRYDTRRNVLISVGAINASCRTAVLKRLEEYNAEQPDQAPQVQAFRTAFERLYERGPRISLPTSAVIPDALAHVVQYDDATKSLQVHGVLSLDDQQALPAWATSTNEADFKDTIDTLMAGTRLSAARPNRPNFTDMLTWLIWPGVTMMVVSALVSLGFSWRSITAAFVGLFGKRAGPPASETGEVGRNLFIGGLILVLILSVCLQTSLFKILWWAAVIGVLLSFVLALVAARVSGEIGITPVGQISKVSQLVLGGLVPRVPAANLMGACVAGGAASQSADLLHDLKCGYLLGASPRLQGLAQVFGALAGALVASVAYLLLVQDPNVTLLGDKLPAPGVLGAKMVAELFQKGFDVLPPEAGIAMLVAAVAGVILAIVEKAAPTRLRPWMLSGTSVGLAFVIPASYSLTIFLGGLIALGLSRFIKSWTARFLITICTGLIVGDTLTSFGTGIHRMLSQ